MGHDSRHSASDPARRLRYYDDRSLAWPETSHWGLREMSCPSSHGHFRPHRMYAAKKLGPTPGPRPCDCNRSSHYPALVPSIKGGGHCSHTIRLGLRVLTVGCLGTPFSRSYLIRGIRSLWLCTGHADDPLANHLYSRIYRVPMRCITPQACLPQNIPSTVPVAVPRCYLISLQNSVV